MSGTPRTTENRMYKPYFGYKEEEEAGEVQRGKQRLHPEFVDLQKAYDETYYKVTGAN